MPKWFWFIAIPFILVFIGVDVYLLYNYLTASKPVLQTTSQNISLSAEIQPGWQLPQSPGICPKSFYAVSTGEQPLVGNLTNIEIQIAKQLTDRNGRQAKMYASQEVQLTGIYHKNGPCGDFIEVTDITSLSPDLKKITVTGSISCLTGTDPDTKDGCTKALQIGDAYIDLTGDSFDINSFAVGDKVGVEGFFESDFITTQNYDAELVVTSIQKI